MNKYAGKNVLIISYTFPPNSGIGGRRWAKFSKYLKKNGILVHVIAGNINSTSVSDWNKDVELYRNKITYLNTGYPKLLNGKPTGLMQKIGYRLSLARVKTGTKGNFYDKSAFWEKELVPQVENAIKTGGIKNIIISCAPFHMAHCLLPLKKKYSHVNFIVDFRDPWTIGKAYGFESLSKKRIAIEKQKEREVIEGYDYVISVADEMTAYFKKLHASLPSKFVTIKNGFDPEDYDEIHENGKENQFLNSDTLKFVFTGSFYKGAVHHFKSLVNALNDIKKSNNVMYNKLNFEFYGDLPTELEKMAAEHSIIHIGDFISLKEVFKKIKSANVGMLFLTDEVNYSFSTKFYEYLSQKKTIAVFTKQGTTSAYIKNNALGYVLTPENLNHELERMVDDFVNKKLIHNPSYSFQEHQISTIVRSVQDLLID